VAELGERAHHRNARAVVDGERHLIPITGQPGEHTGRRRHPAHRYFPSDLGSAGRRGSAGGRQHGDRYGAQHRAPIHVLHGANVTQRQNKGKSPFLLRLELSATEGPRAARVGYAGESGSLPPLLPRSPVRTRWQTSGVNPAETG
jgi:hypothetical protein